MVSPQKENGYTPIANEIMDALMKLRIPGEARQVLDCIIRQTYGWNKKQDAIALSQFVCMTGQSKVHVCISLLKLKTMHLITEKGKAITEKGNEVGQIYEFNKNYESWIRLPKKVTLPKKVIIVTEKGNNPLPKKGTTKAILKQESNLPEPINPDPVKTKDPRVKIFIDWYFQLYQKKFKKTYAIPNGAKTGAQVKKILESGITFEDIQLRAMLFMLDQDPFLVGDEGRTGAGYDIGIYLSRMNKYDPQKAKENLNLTKWLINEKGERL